MNTYTIRWFRSVRTGHIVCEYARQNIDAIFGDGTFQKLIDDLTLEEIESPNVIQILRGTHSDTLAMLRYREIHGCTMNEAKEGVDLLKRDLARFAKYGKGGKKKWKKKSSAKTASTPTSQDTEK